MGDIWHCAIEVAPQDIPLFKRIGYSVDDTITPEVPGCILMAEEEVTSVNWAYLHPKEAKKLTSGFDPDCDTTGIPFIATNFAGGDFCGRTVSDGKEVADAPCLPTRSWASAPTGGLSVCPIVRYGPGGPDQSDVAKVMDFYRVLELAKKALAERIAQHTAVAAS